MCKLHMSMLTVQACGKLTPPLVNLPGRSVALTTIASFTLDGDIVQASTRLLPVKTAHHFSIDAQPEVLS